MNRMLKVFTGVLVSVLGASVFAEGTLINGAGSTFAAPLYNRWASEFKQINADAKVNYQALGSGAGVQQFLKKTVDFGASDDPLKNEEMESAGEPVLNIPTALGSIVITYNVPGLVMKNNQGIRLNADLIDKIYRGKIANWNDPQLAKINPGVVFPKDMPIIVLHRADGSGTTAVFTEYMSKKNKDWEKEIGRGKAVKFPVGQAGKGNDGVTALLKQNPGSLAYVEMTYAKLNKFPVALLQNLAGEFVEPSIESIQLAAAKSLKSMPADFRVSLTDASGKGVYPLASFTYLLVRKSVAQEKKMIFDFINYGFSESGRKVTTELFYAPIPKELATKVQTAMKGLVAKK